MSRRWHVGRDNWFLVIPAVILGLVALWTVNRMYRAGDIRRAIGVVTTYRAQGESELGAWLAEREGPVDCGAEVISRFYGTLDVTCVARDSRVQYRWRVHVGQRAFAPVDEATEELMARYAPAVFAADGEDTEDPDEGGAVAREEQE